MSNEETEGHGFTPLDGYGLDETTTKFLKYRIKLKFYSVTSFSQLSRYKYAHI